jgi:hypothetical protein
MSSVAETDPSAEQRERLFFFIAACLIATVVGAGFSLNLAMGRSSFALPLAFHIHAAAFFGWIALFVFQSALVARGQIRLHRVLGAVSVGFLPAMVASGAYLVFLSFRAGMIPPFYDLREFLVGVLAQLLGFAGLAIVGLALRRRTDWHRRLLFCAAALLAKAGWDRILPVPLFSPFAWWSGAMAVYLFPIGGMAFDRFSKGYIHPAWFWGVGSMVAVHFTALAVSQSELASDAVRLLVAGTPGAERPMQAFVPPM